MWTAIKQFFGSPVDRVIPTSPVGPQYYPNGSVVRPEVTSVQGRHGSILPRRPSRRPYRTSLRGLPNLKVREQVAALGVGGVILIPNRLIRKSYKTHQSACMSMRYYAQEVGFKVSLKTTRRGALLVQRKG